MTKILITIQKPDLSVGLTNTPYYKVIRTLPRGFEYGAYPDGENFTVEIKARRAEPAFGIAQQFMKKYPGAILGAYRHTGKTIENLMPETTN